MSDQTSQDERWMRRALELAARTVALASPNPQVGCVLVSDAGVNIGEGAHRYAARDHAEIVALQQAAARGASVQGATAYVTLEPCSHHGRTGPCADALIAAGIARCVVATADPNPLVRGQGIARMRAAGVVVRVLEVGSALAQQARQLNDAFAFAVQAGRPFVTLKAAVSVDGRLAPPPSLRERRAPVWLTGMAARADVQRLRHASDAILTGIGTVLADDPELSDRSGLERRRPLLRIVLDRELRLPIDSKMVAGATGDLLVVTASGASADRERALLDRGVEVYRAPDRTSDELAALLTMLHERSIRSLLLEAGSAVNGSFLAAGLVDRVVLYFSEVELGEEAMPFAAGQGSPYALQQRLHGVEQISFDHDAPGAMQDVRVSGYLREPWAGV